MKSYEKYFHKVTEIKEAYESGDMLGSQPHIEEMFSNPLGSQPHIEEMFSNPDELIILTEEEFNNKNDEFKQRYE